MIWISVAPEQASTRIGFNVSFPMFMMVHVIYRTQERVFFQDIQTPRSRLKKINVSTAEFFKSNSRCLNT